MLLPIREYQDVDLTSHYKLGKIYEALFAEIRLQKA